MQVNNMVIFVYQQQIKHAGTGTARSKKRRQQ